MISSLFQDVSNKLIVVKSYFIHMYMYISMRVRVFANGQGDLCLFPGRIIPKAQKWNLMPPCSTLNIIRYGSRVKWSKPGKGVAPSPTPRYNNY